ncbi:hypothetical protein FD754_010832 [Muntiacus muntjak]|uniref:VWA N-terminal domain-containing protein n=1 Tax=Muntiacus muntjak TaxID=9888 RepID=A0A5N3X2N7_MUNMU|nr:hypothetical protein FD754_010832 [Muntiacus muntjak]
MHHIFHNGEDKRSSRRVGSVVEVHRLKKNDHLKSILNPAIVNGVYWSESLNKVFVDNFDRDPSLIWQYFGSAKGFFRQYPGIKWEPDENGVIAFDCRNRKWYIQAATSPKDVVILVDVSGSMKGLRMTIAKQTVSSILDTLGDDDFFNIIAYNEELHYVEPCLNGTLVQADRTNKELTFIYLINPYVRVFFKPLASLNFLWRALKLWILLHTYRIRISEDVAQDSMFLISTSSRHQLVDWPCELSSLVLLVILGPPVSLVTVVSPHQARLWCFLGLIGTRVLQISAFHEAKEMATHSSILAWEVPWTEERGRTTRETGEDNDTPLQRKWQPSPVFLPGESQRRRSLPAKI